MTTTIRVRFPWGRYHATPWGRHPNEAAIEWPPSPWRLLRALYAVWMTRCPELDAGEVKGILAKLATLPSYRGPVGRPAHVRHWMPADDHTAIDYKKDLALDAFVALPPEEPLWITWPSVLEDRERDTLARLAAELSYLGRAESICEAALAREDPPRDTGAEWVPASDSAEPRSSGDLLELLSPEPPLDLEALTLAPREVRSSRRLQPQRTILAPYEERQPRARTTPVAASRRRRCAHAVRFHLDAPAQPTYEHVVAIAHLVRAAAMSRYDGQSPVFSGRSERGKRRDDHSHAHYVVFSSQHLERAPAAPNHREPLDTLVVWAPEGLDGDHLDALARIRVLRPPDHIRGVPRLRLGLEVIGAVDAAAPEICGPSLEWGSVTPFLPARFPRTRDFEEHVRAAVRDELAWRTKPPLPAASEIAVDSDPSWRRFRRHRPDGSSLRDARPGRFVKLTLEEPATGPIALGALSHFGLGLFVPLSRT